MGPTPGCVSPAWCVYIVGSQEPTSSRPRRISPRKQGQRCGDYVRLPKIAGRARLGIGTAPARNCDKPGCVRTGSLPARLWAGCTAALGLISAGRGSPAQ